MVEGRCFYIQGTTTATRALYSRRRTDMHPARCLGKLISVGAPVGMLQAHRAQVLVLRILRKGQPSRPVQLQHGDDSCCAYYVQQWRLVEDSMRSQIKTSRHYYSDLNQINCALRYNN